MAEFFPRQGPEYQEEQLRRLVKWAEGEFQRLARTQQETGLVPMQEHHVAIEKPREGMLARADGSDWNPGSGRGTYEYVNGTWRRLNSGDLADPVYIVQTASAALNNERVLTDTATVTWDFATAGQAKANVAGVAPVGASYVVIGLDGTLSAERVLTAGSGIALNDGGANGNVTVSAAAGAILQVLQNTYTANADITAAIPVDDTAPESTEGTEVLSQAITPASTSNKILVQVTVYGSQSTATQGMIVAVFRGTTCIHAALQHFAASDTGESVALTLLDSPASTSAQTYSVRVGVTNNTVRLNGNSTARRFGGTAAATLTVSEVKG